MVVRLQGLPQEKESVVGKLNKAKEEISHKSRNQKAKNKSTEIE